MTTAHQVWHASKSGNFLTVKATLFRLPKHTAKRLLFQRVKDEDSQETTPLIIAARHGHEQIVQFLLRGYEVDPEQKGTVQFDGFVIEGATALWVAAAAGHFSVVRTLVDHDADVNHTTETRSTPLRAACFDGRLDIVKYLIEKGADMNIPNKYNNTCLMISSYKGHASVVSFLLEKGVDPNVKANCGATALHFAAESGHLEVIKVLLKYDAKNTVNDHNMTPLMAAAHTGRVECVEYLLSNLILDKMERIEALELLGASFASDTVDDLDKLYAYLKQAMMLRYEDPNNVLRKRLLCPIPAYNNHKETESLNELDTIKDNPDALQMEALTLRERILGPDNPEVNPIIVYKGAVYADNYQFSKCIPLWRHALYMKFRRKSSTQKDLRRFAQVFAQMVRLNCDVPFESFREIYQLSVTEIERDLERIRCVEQTPPNDGQVIVAQHCQSVEQYLDRDVLIENLEQNVLTVLYLLCIYLKIRTCAGEDAKKEQFEICRLTYRFIRLQVHMRDGQTPLHLVVNWQTVVDDFHVNDVVRFPNATAAELLLRCGADVNGMDQNRNTPLHTIVSYNKPISDFVNLHQVIMLLLDRGCHIDAVNNDGKTAAQSTVTGVAEIILMTQYKVSLQCLAARAVKAYKLPFKHYLPKSLAAFVELH